MLFADRVGRSNWRWNMASHRPIEFRFASSRYVTRLRWFSARHSGQHVVNCSRICRLLQLEAAITSHAHNRGECMAVNVTMTVFRFFFTQYAPDYRSSSIDGKYDSRWVLKVLMLLNIENKFFRSPVFSTVIA